MYIDELTLRNFRNYTECLLHPSPGLNILVGRNAQGKTSLLEAVYLLAMAKSWRAGRDCEMIHWDAEMACVSAKLVREKRSNIEIEVLLSRSGKKRITINTIPQNRLADVIGQLNVVFISPRDEEIVTGEPSERRKFLNLEISQVQPQYCHLLIGYRRVLEQRNKLLKELEKRRMGDGVLKVLDEQLVDYGSKIIERRLAFVNRLAKISEIVHYQLTDSKEKLGIRYVSSIGIEEITDAAGIARKFEETLESHRADEIRRGISLFGPHRDDLAITINNIDARTYGSHGQQRTVALSLRLAELELIEELMKETPIVLFDDVMAGLDEERREHVINAILGGRQSFVTTTTLSLFDDKLLEEGTVFRVSGGEVKWDEA